MCHGYLALRAGKNLACLQIANTSIMPRNQKVLLGCRRWLVGLVTSAATLGTTLRCALRPNAFATIANNLDMNQTAARCHERPTGHISRDCTAPNGGPLNSAGKACYKCGQPGHISRECTAVDGANGQMVMDTTVDPISQVQPSAPAPATGTLI
ncbi:MAG: hypothetical protein Q9228_004277 [Teloschistes exilis]